MKQLFIYAFAVMALTMLTACGNEDEPVNKQTFNVTINARIIGEDNIIFSQGKAYVELDNIAKTIKITTDYKTPDGQSTTIATPEMKLTSAGGYEVYSFSDHSATSSTGPVEGTIDMNSGMMWYKFTFDASAPIVCTTQLLYSYMKTIIINPDNNFQYTNEQSQYLFTLDSDGKTCSMQISNFTPNIAGNVIPGGTIKYNSLAVTPTATGYTITADKAESSYMGTYTITGLHVNLDGQGRLIDGQFKCADLDFVITGSMFPQKVNY